MIIDSPIISGSYLSTGSLSQTGNVSITGSLTATAGISGSFSGSGADLFGIPASGITGLNLSQISSGSVSASISPSQGLLINTSVSASNFTGSFTGSLTGIATSASYASFALTSSYSLGGSGFPFSGSAVITGSLLVSGSAQITGSLSVSGSITGSLFGTASFALDAATLTGTGSDGFTTTASFNAVSSSQQSISASLLQVSASYIALSASYNTFSGSASTRITTISSSQQDISASQQQISASLLTISRSYASTGSNTFVGLETITGSLIVTGSVAISTLVTSSGVRYVIADQNGLLSAQTASAAIFTTQQVVSTAGQTTFPITNGYSTGYVTVFVNGTKLSADEYVDTSGTNIIFLTGSTAGDNVEFQKYLPAAGVSNNTLRSTNYFTATTGQTNFSVNYTPGLIDIFYNGAKLDNTEYTAANGTSITLATASAAGDRLEVDVYSYQVGAFSGIGGTGAANQLAYFNTSNSITGSNAFTVSGSAVIITGSLIVSGSGTFTNIGPAVFSGSVTSTAGFSGSFSGNADSASLAQNSLLLQGTGSIGFATTASLLAVSSSQQQISASLLNVVANYATTGSNSFRADQSITGSLVVSSTITAQTLVVQTVTSSIVYSSGSNIFGSQLSDRQTFTGSLQVTGSGTHTIFGNVAIGTTSTFGKLSILDTDNTTISSALWGSSTGAGVVASVYNASQTTNSVAGIRLVTRDSGASIWNMYNISTGTSAGDLAFGNGTGGAGTEKMRITNSGNVGIGTTNPTQSTLGINKIVEIGGASVPGIILRSTLSTAEFCMGTGGDGFLFSAAGGANAATDNIFRFFTGATNSSFAVTEKMRITSGGNVGIGTTNPDRSLDIYSAATVGIARVRANNVNGAAITIQNDENASAISIYAAGSTAFSISGWAGNSVLESGTGIVYSAYNGNHIFQSGVSGRTERVRITSGGYVGIGNTSPVSRLTVNNAVVGATLPYINGTGLSYNSEGISVAGSNTTNTNIGNGLTLYNNVASVGAYSPVIAFSSMTPGGAYNATYAFITGIYQGSGGDTNWAIGDLMFGTGNQYGAQERMRITAAGNVGIATTSPLSLLQVGSIGNGTVRLGTSSTTNTSSTYSFVAWTSSGNDILGARGDGLVYAPFIYSTFTTGAAANMGIDSAGGFYRSVSSIKYKKNVENYTKGLAEVMQIRPVFYNSINEKEDGILYAGLIAEEIHELGLTEFVQYAKDGTPDALAYQNMIALAFKAIQEQNVLIQELQEKLQRNNIN